MLNKEYIGLGQIAFPYRSMHAALNVVERKKLLEGDTLCQMFAHSTQVQAFDDTHNIISIIAAFAHRSKLINKRFGIKGQSKAVG